MRKALKSLGISVAVSAAFDSMMVKLLIAHDIDDQDNVAVDEAAEWLGEQVTRSNITISIPRVDILYVGVLKYPEYATWLSTCDNSTDYRTGIRGLELLPLPPRTTEHWLGRNPGMIFSRLWQLTRTCLI